MENRKLSRPSIYLYTKYVCPGWAPPRGISSTHLPHPHRDLAHEVSFNEFYEMVTGGNQPPPGLGGAGGVPAGGGGGGTALATTAPLGQNVVQQRNKKKQVGIGCM